MPLTPKTYAEDFAGSIGRTLADSRPHWTPPVRATPGSPNVVVILLDDLGYSDFGCFGGDIGTPHIDALAANGLRFTHYTTVPMCTPARAALLTGKNPHSVGCGWLSHSDPGYPGYKGEMSLDAPTMAEVLRLRGYTTLATGKWHNTYDRNNMVGGDTSAWPMQRGFDRFYGFMMAETSYFQPDNMMEGNQLARVDRYTDDYFAPDDYTSRAIEWLGETRTNTPHKPFFLYLAFQTPHTPLHARRRDRERYKGRYDAGWDALRQARFDRQRAAGLVEPNAILSPRNPGIPAWSDLSPEERALFAAYMEAYAALVDNADQNIGRLVDHLRSTGQLDNTVIMVTSDNGANSVGGPAGTMNLQGKRSGAGENMALNQRLLKEGLMGDKETYMAYPAGWAQVGNTPYRFYKRTPMAGGIRVPFVLHWPQGVAREDRGGIRRQWIHVTDLLPTVMEASRAERPAVFNGYQTRPLDGTSFLDIVRNAGKASHRTRQYYELQGNRGYISTPWKIVSLQDFDTPIDLRNWMLFDIVDDPTEINDLAGARPEVLRRMVEEFENEAGLNYVYPIDNRSDRRGTSMPPHEVDIAIAPREFLRQAVSAPSNVVSPLVADRSFRLCADFDWQPGQEGIIVSIGDRLCGLVLYVEGGALHCTYQWWHAPQTLQAVALRPGAQSVAFDYRALGARRGEGTITLNGRPAAPAVDLSPTIMRISAGGLSVGQSRRMAVRAEHEGKGALAYPGTITRVRIEPGPQAPGSAVVMDEAAAQARMRAPAP